MYFELMGRIPKKLKGSIRPIKKLRLDNPHHTRSNSKFIVPTSAIVSDEHGWTQRHERYIEQRHREVLETLARFKIAKWWYSALYSFLGLTGLVLNIYISSTGLWNGSPDPDLIDNNSVKKFWLSISISSLVNALFLGIMLFYNPCDKKKDYEKDITELAELEGEIRDTLALNVEDRMSPKKFMTKMTKSFNKHQKEIISYKSTDSLSPRDLSWIDSERNSKTDHRGEIKIKILPSLTFTKRIKEHHHRSE